MAEYFLSLKFLLQYKSDNLYKVAFFLFLVPFRTTGCASKDSKPAFKHIPKVECTTSFSGLNIIKCMHVFSYPRRPD